MKKTWKIKASNFIKIIILLIVLILLFMLVYIFMQDKSLQNTTLSSYNIPKMYFVGNIEGMNDKADKRQITVKYESDDISFESYAVLKLQGSYTLKFDKKNYNITFYEDDQYNKKQKYNVKWGEYSKYTLKANWTDPLHSRNIVTAQIASQINEKYGLLTDSVNNGLTDGFPIEVYINGEFLGLYTMNIHKDYLFNIDEENENNIIIFANNPDPMVFDNFETEEWKNYEIEHGEDNPEILNKLNRLIGFVKNSSDEEFKNDFEKYFNKDSVLNYYCLVNFAHLIDNISRNIFLYTDDGEIWYFVPYDFDQSFGNEFKDSSIITDSQNKHTSIILKRCTFWNRFKKAFSDEIAERYLELRKDILTKENLLDKMNNFYSLIPNETLEKEYKKWNDKPNYERDYINEYIEKALQDLDNKKGVN